MSLFNDDKQRGALVAAFIAWCVCMLVAIATFLPADVLGAEPGDTQVWSSQGGPKLSDFERKLVEKFQPLIGQTKQVLIATYGQPQGMDRIEDVCVERVQLEPICFDFRRFLYRIEDMPSHVLIFLINDADNIITGWVIRELQSGEGGDSGDNPFRSRFK